MDYNEKQTVNCESEKSKNILAMVLLLILGLIIGFSIAYFSFNNSNNSEKKSLSTEEEKNSLPIEEEKTPLLMNFDDSKCINCDAEVSYKLAYDNYSTGLSLLVNDNQKEVNLNINWRYFGSFILENNNSSEIKSYTINNFSKKIEDIHVGGFGQATGAETIFYLMEDGTVEYTPVVKAATTNRFVSFGTVKGVKDVVKFYAARDSYGSAAVLAQKADGTFYDLGKILLQTSNY